MLWGDSSGPRIWECRKCAAVSGFGRSFPVLIVFDGMGGESQGEMAAYLASQEFGKYYGQNKGKLRRQPENFLLEACQIMNQAVCSYSASNRDQCHGNDHGDDRVCQEVCLYL